MKVDAVTVPTDEGYMFRHARTVRVCFEQTDSLVVVATSESVDLPLVVNTAIHVIAAVSRTRVVTTIAPERSGFTRILRMKLEEALVGFDAVDGDPIQ